MSQKIEVNFGSKQAETMMKNITMAWCAPAVDLTGHDPASYP
jgi:hypothetical protein